jgi:pyruvate/2-oxoglutarate dehydrogenase complex dihydrolipoamide acyltransferase (E2) component
MPLFRRHDGDLVRGETPMRRIMPYLMRGRNESIVYNDAVYQIERTREWLRAYNRTHPERATLFHLVSYAAAQTLHARPALNRFVAGNRVYQRRGVQVSFVVKKDMKDDGSSTTVKVSAEPEETFAAYASRLAEVVHEAQTTDRHVDKETGLIMMLPGFMVRGLVAAARWLDHWHLYPRFMTESDPMYASVFLANLGSVGVSDVYHHLFEYGTVSIFGAVSAPARMPFVEGDAVVPRAGVRVRWSFDERIHDAFYCAKSLELVRKIVESPAEHLGDAAGAPAFRR